MFDFDFKTLLQMNSLYFNSQKKNCKKEIKTTEINKFIQLNIFVHPSLREFTLLTEIKVKFKCLVISQDLCSYIISPTLRPGRERNIHSYKK